MSVGAIDVISVLGTGISAISFLQGLIPGKSSQGASVSIRTSLGLDMNTGEVGNPNTGGVIQGVYGYDVGNRFLGVSEVYQTIDAGDEYTFTIDQGNNVQALYIGVVAGDDAVCIPVISVTQPGDGLQYGWVGDVFAACGLDNYYGNIDVSGNGDYPRCGWLDANHDNIGQASMKWYLPAFSVEAGSQDYETDRDFYCYPRVFEVRYEAEPIEKRNLKRRGNFNINELILSPHSAHPASKLCEDPTSSGPDFISLDEKTFCDMETKQWYSLCDEEAGLLDNCFDLSIPNKTLTAKFTHMRALSGVQELYSYERVTAW